MDIVAGDAFEVLSNFVPNSIHLVVTDPPYHTHGLDGSWKKGQINKKPSGTVGNLPVGMKFDPKQGIALQEFMERIGELLISALMPGGFAAVFSQPRLVHRSAIGLENAGFEIRDLCAWNFTNMSQFKAFGLNHFVDKMDATIDLKDAIKDRLQGKKTPQLRPQHESIIIAQNPRDGTFLNNYLKYETGLINSQATLDGKVPSNVMKVEKQSRNIFNTHLTIKPLRLIEHLIELLSSPGQTVLDPFLGSGTTAIACKNTGRQCYGIEIDPDYVKIANKRLHGFDES